MNQTEDIPHLTKEDYIESKSHHQLAKSLGVSLLTLQTYASEQGWDKEHKLYWSDVALEVLKNAVEQKNLLAVKEILKSMGMTRPVGRPSKAEVQKNLAIETRITREYEDDIARMQEGIPFRIVK